MLLWVCCITFNLYMNSIKNKETSHYEMRYHLVCWISGSVLSLLPFIGNMYGKAGLWCWIKHNWHWRMFIWYIPLFIGIICLSVIYPYILYKTYKRVRTWEGHYDPQNALRKEAMKRDVRPLIFYPLVYLITSLFTLTNRILDATGHQPNFAVLVLAVLTNPLRGALFAIAFGFNSDVMNNLRPSIIWAHLQARLPGGDTSPIITDFPLPEQPAETQQPTQQADNVELNRY